MAPTDYQRIEKAITYMVAQVKEQPRLEAVAAQVHLSPYHFQRLFSRWVGITPKRFLQALTLEQSKPLLQQPGSLLEAANASGLSSSSRLYDHYVKLEAVTPGEFQKGGEGLTIDYGVAPTPFGPLFVAGTARGVCQVAFLDSATETAAIQALAQRWPQARIRENSDTARHLVEAMLHRPFTADRPLSLLVSGTNFQVAVWRALLNIPTGQLTSYAKLAKAIGKPQSTRALANAVGANPVAFFIPCHRVIRQSGALGGYRWGIQRKQALQAWECARVECLKSEDHSSSGDLKY